MKTVRRIQNIVESLALTLMIVSIVTGCMKTGKGVRIHDNITKPVAYPVIEMTTTMTNTTMVTTTTITTTASETAEESSEAAVVPLVFIEPDSNAVEDDVNVDVTETSFETYDYGYYPSVANGYITEEERIFLCNTVGTEYGADWVSLYDKAMVVDTVMTRVEQGCWTNGLDSTVYNVLTAPNQYNPWYAEGYYHDCVTQSCIDAVEYYFQHRDEFPHYTSFWGDGVENHFYN